MFVFVSNVSHWASFSSLSRQKYRSPVDQETTTSSLESLSFYPDFDAFAIQGLCFPMPLAEKAVA